MPGLFYINDEQAVDLDPHRFRPEAQPRPIGLKALRSAARRARRQTGRSAYASSPHLQRCVVIVQFTRGGSPGKWKSIARYIAREAANPGGLGFSQGAEPVPIVEPVRAWRKLYRDEVLWRIIISPEFGDRVDLDRLVKDTMAAMEVDLKPPTKLEWVAAIHRNTDNPHTHVLLRGRRDDGTELAIPKDYVKAGMRRRAQEAVTVQLGHRTEQDMAAAESREVTQMRFTGLDRKLQSRATAESPWLRISIDPPASGLDARLLATENRLLDRLRELRKMGLALTRDDPSTWFIPEDFEASLRAMQKTRDRQKMIIEHGFMPLKADLPFRVVRAKQIERIEGRILVHGHNEYTGSNFMLVETHTEILQVPHTKEIAFARQHGNCPAGNAVLIVREGSDPVTFNVQDLGPSHFAGPAI